MSDSSWIEMPKPPCNGSDAVNQPTKTGNTRQSQLHNRLLVRLHKAGSKQPGCYTTYAQLSQPNATM